MKPTSIALVMLTATGNVLAEDTHRQHQAHVHGHAELNLAISGQHVQIEFDSPAMNLVGFEHAPGSEQDRKRVDDSVAFLKNPSSWIGLQGARDCRVTHVDVDSSLLTSDSHDRDAHDGHQHEQHADFEVRVEFACRDADQIEKVDLSGLFQRFSGFDEIEVQWLTDHTQSATQLHSANPVISVR